MLEVVCRCNTLKSVGVPSDSHSFTKWTNEARYGFITVVGESGKGKTQILRALMIHMMSLSGRKVAGYYDFLFASAGRAFADASRKKFDDDANDLDLLQNVCILALDDLDEVDQRERTLVTQLLSQRSDSEHRLTLLSVSKMNNVRSFGPRIMRRVEEGNIIRL